MILLTSDTKLRRQNNATKPRCSKIKMRKTTKVRRRNLFSKITSSWRNLEVNIKVAKRVSNIWCQTTPFSQDYYSSNMKRILNMIQNEWIEKLSVDEDPNEVSSKSKTAISSTNHFPSTTYYLLTSKVLALLQNPSQRISRKSLKSHSTLSQN